MDRTLDTCPHEDHMEFCFAFRQQCAWYNEKEFVKLSVERGIHAIQGPANMSSQASVDIRWQWIQFHGLYLEKRHEFDHFLTWQAEFIRYLIGWLTQDGENEFQRKCDSFFVDMASKHGSKPNYFRTSRALSGKLRHCEKRCLFNASGTMSLGNAFAELDWQNPLRLRMSPSDFAALLLANDTKRFKIEILVNWVWKPFGYPPTHPWEIRIGCNQGHSNQLVDP